MRLAWGGQQESVPGEHLALYQSVRVKAAGKPSLHRVLHVPYYAYAQRSKY